MRLHISIGRSKVFDLFPRTYKGKKSVCFMEKTRFDKFPRTNEPICGNSDINLEQSSHVETVCLLSNRKPDTNVRIDVLAADA